jgi:hypothetical protein
MFRVGAGVTGVQRPGRPRTSLTWAFTGIVPAGWQ